MSLIRLSCLVFASRPLFQAQPAIKPSAAAYEKRVIEPPAPVSRRGEGSFDFRPNYPCWLTRKDGVIKGGIWICLLGFWVFEPLEKISLEETQTDSYNITKVKRTLWLVNSVSTICPWVYTADVSNCKDKFPCACFLTQKARVVLGYRLTGLLHFFRA